ncbi:MAG: HAMP domain-containing sensor histidine kinase [Bdellovibrionota bacterium]
MTIRLKLFFMDLALILCLLFPIVFYSSATSHQVDALRVNLAHAESVNSAFLDLSEIKRRIETLLFRMQYSNDQGRAQKVIAASQDFRSIILNFRKLETSDHLLEGFVDRYTDAELKIISGYLEIAALEIANKASKTWPVRNQLALLEPSAVVYKTDLSSYLTNLIFDYTREMEEARASFLRLVFVSLFIGMAIILLRYRFIRNNVIRPLSNISSGLTRIRDGRRLVILREVPESPEFNEVILSFNEMGKGLEKNRQYREIFSAITAHDLKEPLGAILSLVRLREMELMEESKESSPEAIDFLKRIGMNSTIGLNMIDALLQLSRSSFREMSYEELDLDQIVNKNFTELKVFHFNRQSNLKLNGPLGRVYGDLRQIETLFRNLFSNSIKFGQPDRSSVSIDVWATELVRDGIPYRDIHIRDDGVGFNTSEYEKLLKPFERAVDDNDQKNESELHFMRGVGLGLAVCFRILENHRGLFSASSQVGVGSEFILSFPLLSAEELTAARGPKKSGLLY